MVVGIDKIREHFAGHEDYYAIIGGAACDLLFDTAGLAFRATRDIDMVLCLEVVDAAFGERLSGFLDAGGYKARERSDGKREFYRFHQPTDKTYPFMIELFSRKPKILNLRDDATITPIPVDEDTISLSAILLEDDYYNALQSSKRVLDGVTVLDETLLIPFKARAFLDLSARLEQGENIDRRNIRKHRNDVFRLIQLIPRNAAIEIADSIRDDLRSFLELMDNDETLDPRTFDVRMTREEGVALLRAVYRLSVGRPGD